MINISTDWVQFDSQAKLSSTDIFIMNSFKLMIYLSSMFLLICCETTDWMLDCVGLKIRFGLQSIGNQPGSYIMCIWFGQHRELRAFWNFWADTKYIFLYLNLYSSGVTGRCLRLVLVSHAYTNSLGRLTFFIRFWDNFFTLSDLMIG